jgi:hypothetical protein
MTSGIGHIASALLPFSDDQQIRDLLFRKAAHADSCAFGPAPSRDVAMSFYKGDLGHVLAIASNPSSDLEVLAKFVKDTRVSVRSALIRNRSLPYEGVVTIARWALGRRDDAICDVALPRLSAQDFVALAVEAASTHKLMFRSLNLGPETCSSLAEKLAADAESCRAAIRLGNRRLTFELARMIHTVGISGLSLREVVELDPDSSHVTISTLAKQYPMLTVDLATAMLELAESRTVAYPDEPFTLVEEGSVELLVSGRPEHVVLALINGVDEQLIRSRVAEMTMTSLAALVEVARSGRVLSPETEAALVARFIEFGGEENQRSLGHSYYSRITLGVPEVLDALRHPLPQNVLLQLLRLGSDAATRSWLHRSADPQFPNALRPGMLKKLVQKPGSAFARFVQGSTPGSYGQVWKKLPGSAIESYLSSVSGACTPELTAEVVDLFDQQLGSNLGDRHTARITYPVMRQMLGTDLEAWETALMLAAEWNGTFTDLVNAVSSLVGISQPLEPPTPEPDAADSPSEQLQLI